MGPPADGRRGARSGKLALLLGSAVATLAALELGARLLPEPPATNAFAGYVKHVPRIVERRPVSSYREIYPLDHDARGYYAASRGIVDYHFDQAGGRWLRPESRPFVGDVALVVGDSFTLGAGLRYEDAFVRRTEEALGGSVTLVNLAKPGAEATRCAEIYLGRADRVPHVALLYGLNLNDAIRFVTSYMLAETHRSPTPFDFLAERSRLASRLLARLERSRERERKLRELTDPEMLRGRYFRQCMDACVRMDRECRRRGVAFRAMVLPTLVDVGRGTFAPVYARLVAELGSRGISTIDLTGGLEAHRDEELWILPFDQHPNEIANAVFADRLVEALRARPLRQEEAPAR